MPADLYYTTDQVAKDLGTSIGAIRSLCASGAIAHKTTTGRQYRLPGAVLAQLKRDGLPVPRPLPDEGGSRPTRKNMQSDQRRACLKQINAVLF